MTSEPRHQWPDTPWEEYTPEIDRRSYRGHSLVVLVLKSGVAWFVDEFRLQRAASRELAREAAERFVEDTLGGKP